MVMSNGDLNVLFVGDLNKGTRSFSRFQALQDIVYSVEGFSLVPIPFIGGINRPSLISRVSHKMGFPLDLNHANKALMKRKASDKIFDICWVDCAALLNPKTLSHLRLIAPQAVFITVSEDDMNAKHNRTFFYDESLCNYDIAFTTKPLNLDELLNLGARRTALFYDSFYKSLHRPLAEFQDISTKNVPISFVGTYEEERAESVFFLANSGFRVEVYGSNWDKFKKSHPLMTIHFSPVLGDDYVEIINRSVINLGFLRKINRDEVTSRTLEIVGCSGFFLGERTSAHSRIFTEGKDADFFSDNEELLKKVIKYSKNPELTTQIAKSGRLQALRSGFELKNQVRNILSEASLLIK